MKCVDVEYLLDELVDGSLSGVRRAEVLRHMESCEGCREAERCAELEREERAEASQ